LGKELIQMSGIATQAAVNNGYSLYVRPISPAESTAAVRSLRSARYNAVAMAIVGVITAIMINYANDEIVMVVPFLFVAGAVGNAVQYRKGAEAVKKMLRSGNIHEVRGTPVRKSMGRGWTLGPVTLPKSGSLNDIMTEGSSAGIAFVPDTKNAISVNGTLLKKPLPMTVPMGFGKELSTSSNTQAPSPIPQVSSPISPRTYNQPDDDLPPPPDDWVAKMCPRCGQHIGEGVTFCSKCGFRLKA
jgi:hypothetical protein